MVKKTQKGDVLDINMYRIWLLNFEQSTHGKFLVFGNKDDAEAAIVSLKKGVMKGYPYDVKPKEITEKMR